MKTFKSIAIVLLALWGAVSLFPLVWMFFLSVKEGTAVISTPPDLSLHNFTLANFKKILSSNNIWVWTGNSYLVALSSMLANAVFGTMAGYAFAKKVFPGRHVLFWMILLTMMVSNSVIIVPLFMLVRDMGLLNSYAGLILPILLSPFGVFLSRQFISTLPNELLASAKIDGCSEWSVFLKIVLPLCMPVVAIISIFTFISHWNEFLWPLLATDSKGMRTLQVGLASMQMETSRNFGSIIAGAAWTSLPVIIIFFSLQRYFVKGLTVGAVKG